jgi:mycothiol synthase
VKENEVEGRLMAEGWVFQAPKAEDAGHVFDLMSRCETAEYGEPDVDMEDLTHDWGQISLERDAWLTYSHQGNLVGYAAVLPWGSDLRYDFYVDPEQEGLDLSLALLARCQHRGQELADDGESVARVYVAHSNLRDRETVTVAGFRVVRYHFQMRATSSEVPAKPNWPDGITLRLAVPGQDDAALHLLVQQAFDHPGRIPQSFESWKDSMMRPDIFDPCLWFVAVHGEDIAGACLTFEYPGEGWVRQLAVSEQWRRRGLGSALLQHTFRVYHERGQHRVGLAVAADNAGAHAFYQNVGMERVRQYDEYNQKIRA